MQIISIFIVFLLEVRENIPRLLVFPLLFYLNYEKLFPFYINNMFIHYVYIIFWRYKTNRLAFRFLYLGWNYQGFASQENTENTIEVSKL